MILTTHPRVNLKVATSVAAFFVPKHFLKKNVKIA